MQEKGIEMDFLTGGQPDICQRCETVSERVMLQEYKHLCVKEKIHPKMKMMSSMPYVLTSLLLFCRKEKIARFGLKEKFTEKFAV